MRIVSVWHRFSAQLIWKDVGTEFHLTNIRAGDCWGGSGVLVWGGIAFNGQTELHISDKGSLTSDHYCDGIILPHVCMFQGTSGPDFVLMDDNSRPHRSYVVEERLECEDICKMHWPASSPHLNPIDHLWDALERRLAAQSYPLKISLQTTETDAEWGIKTFTFNYPTVLVR